MTSHENLPSLSEVQLELMNVVWERGECSVADVWKVLNERRGVSRNTVHTLIVRLEEKGWLKRRDDDDGILYSPTVTQQSSQQLSVRQLIDTVFDGSPEGLVLTLLNEGTVSKDEAARIRKLIAKARGKKS